MSLLRLLFNGLTQMPSMSSNLVSSFGLLLLVTAGPLPLVNETTIGIYLALQLLWCLLLWVRSVRVVGSQSMLRLLEADARNAALTWLDVLRIAAVGWAAKYFLHFEAGAQMCELYCGVIALRTLLKPLAYAVLRVYGGPAVAARFTGFDPSSLSEGLGWSSVPNAASGPAWKQHVKSSKKATSATKRLSSLTPAPASRGEAKNNNDRCCVLEEGPHFNRTARGCLLNFEG